MKRHDRVTKIAPRHVGLDESQRYQVAATTYHQRRPFPAYGPDARLLTSAKGACVMEETSIPAYLLVLISPLKHLLLRGLSPPTASRHRNPQPDRARLPNLARPPWRHWTRSHIYPGCDGGNRNVLDAACSLSGRGLVLCEYGQCCSSPRLCQSSAQTR